MALWSGRFEDDVNRAAAAFGDSLPFDRRLYAQDIAGSKSHAAMLASQGIISAEDGAAIVAGLDELQAELEAGAFRFVESDEDIHMAIERALTERIGDAGARLHTGRSRNDQVALDMRLYARSAARRLMDANCTLRRALLAQAEAHPATLMPGYTHLQHAQPVLFAHHLLAYFWMFTRDFARIAAADDAANVSPLGAAALAGTSYPIDREATARALGLDRVAVNSLDAVSDRDFLLDLTYATSVSALHLTRIAEELVLWSTSEFGFITLSDSFSTGSSIMPQKKNPDFAELIRGKSGRVIGDMIALMITLKGLPLAYNKDLQEDKEGVFDAVDTTEASLRIMAGMIETLSVNEDAMAAQLTSGFLAATDMADYLVRHGLPFRDAHRIVGQLVHLCESQSRQLEDLTLDELKAASPLFEEDILGLLSPAQIADARQSSGGTARNRVAEQMDLARKTLEQDEEIA